MRIGTWNLAGRWSTAHAELVHEHACDVWLLTEVSHRLDLGGVLHRSAGDIARKRSWAAVWAPALAAVEPDPHPASAAAVVGDVYMCSSILPWRSCGTRSPWEGERHADKTVATLDHLRSGWPAGSLVWGGDWNHGLVGKESAGSMGGRQALLDLLVERDLQVPTAELPHRLPGRTSIDHVAVPTSWTAEGRHVDAVGLSDHDAYVVDVHRA